MATVFSSNDIRPIAWMILHQYSGKTHIPGHYNVKSQSPKLMEGNKHKHKNRFFGAFWNARKRPIKWQRKGRNYSQLTVTKHRHPYLSNPAWLSKAFPIKNGFSTMALKALDNLLSVDLPNQILPPHKWQAQLQAHGFVNALFSPCDVILMMSISHISFEIQPH